MATPLDSTASTRTTTPPPDRTRRLSPLAIVVALLAVGLGLMAMFSGFGNRWGLWTFRTGFSMLRWAAYGGIGVALLSLLALYDTRPSSPRRGLPLAVFALLAGFLLFFIPWQWQQRARGVPPIHDITTDTQNPPQFVAVAPLRADASNSMEYGGPEVAARQIEAYPDIQPLVLDMATESAFELALEGVRDMGWELVEADAGSGRIEATDQTFWFGFKDDVVIRLTPLGERTVLDVRSLSRVGGGDVGTNAKRIRAYLDEVRTE
jgi:uncharacterized protein (DUF1499 family)